MSGPEKSPRANLPGIDIRKMPPAQQAPKALLFSPADAALQRVQNTVDSVLTGLNSMLESGQVVDPHTMLRVGMLINDATLVTRLAMLETLALATGSTMDQVQPMRVPLAGNAIPGGEVSK